MKNLCKSRGLTLVELLVVVAISALLAAMAVPNFRDFLVRRSVAAATSALASDYRLARSEAIRRSSPVTICRSTDGASCAAAGSWHDGWIVFSDLNGNQAVDTGDELIRVQSSLSGITSMQAAGGPSGTKQAATFRFAGLAPGSGETLIVTGSSSVQGGTASVVISNHGRASIR